MFRMIEEVNERLEMHDDIFNDMRGVPRQRRQPPIEQEEYNGKDILEDDQITLVGHPARQARRDHVEEVDRNLGSIKMKIPPFQMINDPDMYLEWERKVDLTFECLNYSEDKKVKLASVEFYDYVIVWWDQFCKEK